jgi:hypothetical protein
VWYTLKDFHLIINLNWNNFWIRIWRQDWEKLEVSSLPNCVHFYDAWFNVQKLVKIDATHWIYPRILLYWTFCCACCHWMGQSMFLIAQIISYTTCNFFTHILSKFIPKNIVLFLHPPMSCLQPLNLFVFILNNKYAS